MGSDSISNSPAPAFSKDSGKKKRTNRLAKLKQCKLDVRREQWLSHVKSKECKMELNGRGESPPSSMRTTIDHKTSLENLEMRSRGEENEGLSIHDSDMESMMHSPAGSSLGLNDSRKDLHGSSSSSNSSGCCSENVSEEEDDGCLDDWEAVADALTADENQHNPNSEPSAVPESRVRSTESELHENNSAVDLLKTEIKGMVSESQGTCRAWRPDDVSRPQSLPNLSKQHSFPTNLDRHCGHGVIPWAWRSIISQPSSCPICCEDLDLTDTSFLPCSCGFRLCLFCHKRILEADGRCPGCRKQYDLINADTGFNGGATPFRMAHSCSMSMRG
ncbi:hypothetical protein L1049_003305 [Liquidambar formosana]|uniref:RING-type domain-containing protein n=1 Tax=Liquidambar formosana TaxID=63359 RepID=A0AAP0R9J8_LIQFO